LSSREKTIDLDENYQVPLDSASLSNESTKKNQTPFSLKKHTPPETILFLTPTMNKKCFSEVSTVSL
jgi:hypothetical protein